MGWIVTGVLVVGSVGWAPSNAGGQAPPPGCPQPQAPDFFDEARPSTLDVITLPTVDATVVPQGPVGQTGPIDSDGDGTDDGISEAADSVTLTRGDGSLVLTVAGATQTRATLVGDIDGDGRDEFQVSVIPSGETFLIPGTTAPGTMAASDAGITFGPKGLELLLPDDGSNRLVSTRSISVPNPGDPPLTETRAASVVLALGPGGDASALSATVSIDLPLISSLDLGDPVATLLLAAPRVIGMTLEGTAIDVVVVRGDEVTTLTTLPEPYYPPTSFLVQPEVLDGPGGTFVRLVVASRSGTGAYMWSLTDPCTPLTATTTPPAAPASPISTDAAFTG